MSRVRRGTWHIRCARSTWGLYRALSRVGRIVGLDWARVLGGWYRGRGVLSRIGIAWRRPLLIRGRRRITID